MPPVMRVSGLGLMAFRGHLKHPVVLTCLHNVAKRNKKQANCELSYQIATHHIISR